MAGLIIFLLSSCGFQLRGSYQLPVQMANTLVIADNKNSELVRALKRALTANRINIVDTRQQAQAVLTISAEQQKKRVLSVDAQGRVREYEVNYQLSFEVSSDQGDFSISRQTIKLQREFLFDTENVLGKSREQAALVKDMQQDMVRLIMLRLQATTAK
jgi:LPS-assembly lipoprotein